MTKKATEYDEIVDFNCDGDPLVVRKSGKQAGFRILSDFVWVLKCYNEDYLNDDGSVLLYRTDADAEFTHWAQIIDVGPDCELFTKAEIGEIVTCPEIMTGMHRMFGEHFAIREDLLKPYTVVS